MKDLLDFFKGASLGLIIVVTVTYFLKVYLEKRIDGLIGRGTDIGRTSLDLKKSLRNEERAELLAFRVAVEKWEYALQTLLFDFTMLSPSDAQIADFYKADKELFFNVKLAVVRASTYLRDPELEVKLMGITNKIRNTYYPMIGEAMPRLIDLQAGLLPIEYKMKQFEKSGLTDMAFAPTDADREEHLRLQTEMTEETSKFASRLIDEYQNIAVQMVELKQAVNDYLYRPVARVELDHD